MSTITLRVRFEVADWKNCVDGLSSIQNFADKLWANLAKIRQFVPEVNYLFIASTPQQEDGADKYRFGGELLIDQASTLGQYVWMGKPETVGDRWIGDHNSALFIAIGIITDRIFCVPFQPIDRSPEEMFGISCEYTLFLKEIVVNIEGVGADTYLFEDPIRDSGGGRGLAN